MASLALAESIRSKVNDISIFCRRKWLKQHVLLIANA